jgi:Transglycosylase SLT domain
MITIIFNPIAERRYRMKHRMIVILAMVITLFSTSSFSQDNSSEQPSDPLAKAIMKLQPKHNVEVASIIAREINKYAQEYNMDPELILGLIMVESEISPFALSDKGAVGLMQVRYKTWKEEPELKDNGVDARHKLFWIDANIKCGTAILKKYYDESNHNIGATLYRYNTGAPKLDKQPWDIAYVNRILYYTYKIREFIQYGDVLELEDADQVNKQDTSSTEESTQPATKASKSTKTSSIQDPIVVAKEEPTPSHKIPAKIKPVSMKVKKK